MACKFRKLVKILLRIEMVSTKLEKVMKFLNYVSHLRFCKFLPDSKLG